MRHKAHRTCIIDINGISTAVIKDRKLLSTDGMVAVLIAMDSRTNQILKKPEIITQGFIYPDEKSLKLLNSATEELHKDLNNLMKSKVTFGEIKNITRSTIGKILFEPFLPLIKTLKNRLLSRFFIFKRNYHRL